MSSNNDVRISSGDVTLSLSELYQRPNNRDERIVRLQKRLQKNPAAGEREPPYLNLRERLSRSLAKNDSERGVSEDPLTPQQRRIEKLRKNLEQLSNQEGNKRHSVFMRSVRSGPLPQRRSSGLRMGGSSGQLGRTRRQEFSARAHTFGEKIASSFGGRIASWLNLTSQTSDSEVIAFLYEAFEYVENHMLTADGIYRRSPDHEQLNKAYKEFEERLNFSGIQHHEAEYLVPDLIKKILRERPEVKDLIPEHACQKFNKIEYINGEAYVDLDPEKKENVLNAMREAYAVLDPEKKKLFSRILEHTLKVVVNIENKMDAYALAVIFSPNIFPLDKLMQPLIEGNNPQEVYRNINKKMTGILAICIEKTVNEGNADWLKTKDEPTSSQDLNSV